MNKTLSINIAGFAFTIEETAYHELQGYLNAIKQNFQNDSERKEIMEDIEARVAEIFREKINSSKREVVLTGDVEEVIEIMGRPEDYITTETVNNTAISDDSLESQEQLKGDRVLYRDGENAMIGGVCSGLAHYFKMDPSLMRIFFVLFALFLGGGILVYIILLLVIPEAKTTSEKISMKGQKITIDSIKDHVNTVKSSIKEGAKGAEGTLKKNVNKVVGASGNFMRSFAKIIGVFFLFGGICILFSFLMLFFSSAALIPIVEVNESASLSSLINILYPGSNGGNMLLILSILLLVLIPIIGIIITGVKMLFNYKKSNRPFTISMIIIWSLAFGYCIFSSAQLGMHFRNRAEVKTEIKIQDTTADILYVDVADILSDPNTSLKEIWNISELVNIEAENITFNYPKLHIMPVDDTANFAIQLNKESCGYTVKNAVFNAERIEYNLQLDQNKLSLPSSFKIPREDKVRAQYPSVIIQVPNGKRIELGSSIDRINISMAENKYCSCDYNYANTTWVNVNGVMNCVACQGH